MLTATEIVALSKASPKANKVEPSTKLPVGTHEVDFLVHIFGTITKGEDYDSAVYQAVPFDLLFALAMSHLNGVTTESIVREALSILDQNGDTQRNAIKEIKASVDAAVKKLVKATTKNCSGKTTAKLSVEKLGISSAA